MNGNQERGGKEKKAGGKEKKEKKIGTWAVLFLGGLWHDHLAQPKARHDTKCFGSYRHDTNTRAVPCLGSQHDGLYGTTRILSRAWAVTA